MNVLKKEWIVLLASTLAFLLAIAMCAAAPPLGLPLAPDTGTGTGQSPKYFEGEIPQNNNYKDLKDHHNTTESKSEITTKDKQPFKLIEKQSIVIEEKRPISAIIHTRWLDSYFVDDIEAVVHNRNDNYDSKKGGLVDAEITNAHLITALQDAVLIEEISPFVTENITSKVGDRIQRLGYGQFAIPLRSGAIEKERVKLAHPGSDGLRQFAFENKNKNAVLIVFIQLDKSNLKAPPKISIAQDRKSFNQGSVSLIKAMANSDNSADIMKMRSSLSQAAKGKIHKDSSYIVTDIVRENGVQTILPNSFSAASEPLLFKPSYGLITKFPSEKKQNQTDQHITDEEVFSAAYQTMGWSKFELTKLHRLGNETFYIPVGGSKELITGGFGDSVVTFNNGNVNKGEKGIRGILINLDSNIPEGEGPILKQFAIIQDRTAFLSNNDLVNNMAPEGRSVGERLKSFEQWAQMGDNDRVMTIVDYSHAKEPFKTILIEDPLKLKTN